jgi:hypothetical protein
MDPKVWGPGLWKYFHTAAAAADTPEKRDAFVAMIPAIHATLPCKKCKEHFAENQRKYDIRNYKQNQETLLMWTYLMHDAVNQAQGKTADQRPSWLAVRAMYFDVPTDAAAVGPVTSDLVVCKEICLGQTIPVTKETPKKETTLKISSKNGRK